MKSPLEDAADGDAAKVFRVVKVGNEDLQGAVRVAGGRGNGGDDGLKQRLQIDAGNGGIEGCSAVLGHAIKYGKIKLRFVRIEIDEKIVNFVQHFLRAGVGAIDLVDHHDGQQLGFKRLGKHVAGLRQWAFGCVNQQHYAVYHLERTLHFAAEIGVSRRVHDIDFAAFKDDGRVFGQDGDAALPFQFIRVHHTVGHLLIGAERSRLPQHGIYEGCLAVVNMGNDGDIAYRLGHREVLSFLFRPPNFERRGYGGWERHGGESPHNAAISILSAGCVSEVQNPPHFEQRRDA